MTLDNGLGLVLANLVAVYLVVALILPERL